MKVTQKDELKKKTNITLFEKERKKHKNAVIKSIFVFITQTERKKVVGVKIAKKTRCYSKRKLKYKLYNKELINTGARKRARAPIAVGTMSKCQTDSERARARAHQHR
uniref:(northern house mosquito) hypothetical protein n=1 Tax=Culex pipiens TaxID=7175 RepID=A0A8D8CP30_CULPI